MESYTKYMIGKGLRGLLRGNVPFNKRTVPATLKRLIKDNHQIGAHAHKKYTLKKYNF